jgi:hypothetical protein
MLPPVVVASHGVPLWLCAFVVTAPYAEAATLLDAGSARGAPVASGE